MNKRDRSWMLRPVVCSSCGKTVPGYAATSYRTAQRGSVQACWPCFNREYASAMGIEKFEQLEFEPVRVVDCEGTPHDFHFRTRLFGRGGEPGVALDAFELVGAGIPGGHQFLVIGDPDGDLVALLGRLIEKIRRALEVRHLEADGGSLRIAERVVAGRIEWDPVEERRGPVVVVDGQEIPWHQLGMMLEAFEGWQFRLEIVEMSDEV